MRRKYRCFEVAPAISATLFGKERRSLSTAGSGGALTADRNHSFETMGKRSKSTKVPTQRWGKDSKALRPPREPHGLRIDLWWLLPALVLGFLVYTNTLGGEFVYDDEQQIVRNTLIQDRSQFWHAMTSDVWGVFAGEQAVSNYWRPSFVFWMILNFRCFGLATFGWHLASILLHLAVIALAFAILRRLAVSRPIAGAIALIFAVHPAHSESVAWISGAPDLILGTALLGSLWFVNLLGEKKTPLRWALSIGLYLVALGAKEIAILYPLIAVAVLFRGDRDPGEKSGSWAQILSIVWPFAAVAVIYLITRRSILGTTARFPEGAASLGEAILTAPAVFAFYFRQMIVPFWIGPSYPLRAVTPDTIGVGNFIIPLVVTIVAGWWMFRMARLSRIARIGLALFLIPLVPAMNIVAFGPEHLVHDRYLYVPLLGFLILVIPACTSWLQRIGGERIVRQSLLIFIVAMIVSVPLAAATVRYNRAWTSNLALWEWGVRADSSSAFSYQQYGVHLQEAKRPEEAVAAFNRSIEIAPMASTYVTLGNTLIEQQKFAEAERDLREVTSKKRAEVASYTLYRAYRNLAESLVRQSKPNEAADALIEARGRLPHYTAALTEKLATVLYKGGRKNEALRELNAVRAQARTENLPESRMIFYGLGLLNEELGHPQDARDAFREFLSVTQGMLTPPIKQARSKSEVALRDLGRQDPR
jgi:protein O-mannosyl-transferase